MKNRKPNRLPFFDYSNPAWYFVTICTKNHIQHFGKVQNGKMILNQFGKIVENAWNWLSEQYDYCKLDEYVVMPNHFHGIIIIDPEFNQNKRRDSSRAVLTIHNNIQQNSRDNSRVVPTNYVNIQQERRDKLRLIPTKEATKHIKIKSLSELVGAFKTKSSKEIHLAGNPHFK